MEEEARERTRELARYLYYLSIDYVFFVLSYRILFVLKKRQNHHYNAVFFYFFNSRALKVLNLSIFYFLRPDRVKLK
jgi:hypothetical protein